MWDFKRPTLTHKTRIIMNVSKNKLYRAKHLMASGALLLASGLVATSCIDSSFDLNEDIDMTMAFGGDSLSLKLGSTGKVYLDDILDIDKSVKLDDSNVYYLVEEGSTNVDFTVNTVKTTIRNATLHADQELFNFSEHFKDVPAGITTIPVPSDWSVSANLTGQTNDFSFTLSNIQSEVKSIEEIYPKGGTKVSLSLKLVTSKNVKAKFTEITNLKITMPEYLRMKSVSQGTFKDNVITIPKVANPGTGEFCRIDVECIDLGEDGEISENSHSLVLPIEKSHISMSGTFKLGATESFNVTASDKIKLEMDIVLGSGVSGTDATLEVEKVVGKFDPTIDPNIESINIQEELPDFLQDEEVRIAVANPTLRFDVDMTQIPVSLDFSGKLIAHKAGMDDKTVVLPESGKAAFLKSKQNCVYFCQQDTPYDPTGLVASATKHKVSNLGDLINQLPEYIKVDVGNKQITVKDELATIQLGKNYKASMDYKIFVPFQFNSGLKIVYRDSTNSLNEDLQDYQAEGLVVKATAYSTVPLDLSATVYPVDVDGNEISTIKVDQVKIQASNDGATEKATEMEVSVKLTDPKDLQKVDRFLFRVSADAKQSNLSLNSKQYLRFDNVRLQLKGKVIGDFN